MQMEEIDHVIDIIYHHVILIANSVELDADSMIEDGNMEGSLHG
jgi:hypothetical protein